jgi:hypothetical protein
MTWKTLAALTAAFGLLGLIPACPAPQHPDIYEGGTFTGDDDAVGDDDTGDDDTGDDDTGDDDTVGPDDDDNGPDVNQFFNDYVDAFCARALECYESAILEHLGWSNMNACRQWMSDNSVDPVDCVYDASHATSCLDQVSNVDCDDFVNYVGMDDCNLALICD